MNLLKLLRMFRAYRAGAPLGDVAVLKLDGLSTPPAAVVAKLGALADAPAHDVAALRALPRGTLGREYARFLDANKITPLVISPALRSRYRDRPYALRYTVTHDLHHVLAGFDTSLAGEIGVLAFEVGQGAAPLGRAWLWLVRLLFTLRSPLEAGAIGQSVRLGLERGRRAALVIAEPLEAYFGEPLGEVRGRLGISA